MKLSVWAKSQGVTYTTAWKWFRTGQLPVPARQLANGTILVDAETVAQRRVVVYSHASGDENEARLDGRVLQCVSFANSQGLAVNEVVPEVGSRGNDRRSKLLRLLADKTVGVIVVSREDEFVQQMGEYFAAALGARGARLMFVDPVE